VKSFKKASVDGGWICAGAGAGTVMLVVGDCCVEDEAEEAALFVLMGDEMGASMAVTSMMWGEQGTAPGDDAIALVGT
jgi:hypothetical protein